MCSCHSIPECCVIFSGVKLSMGSFILFRQNVLISRFYEHFKKFLEICFAFIFAKFKDLGKQFILTEILTESPDQTCFEMKNNTVFPRFSAPARFSAPHKTSNFDKRPLQISLDFDQKDGEPELFLLSQLTSKSLGLFFFIEYSVKYLFAVQKMISL